MKHLTTVLLIGLISLQVHARTAKSLNEDMKKVELKWKLKAQMESLKQKQKIDREALKSKLEMLKLQEEIKAAGASTPAALFLPRPKHPPRFV